MGFLTTPSPAEVEANNLAMKVRAMMRGKPSPAAEPRSRPTPSAGRPRNAP